MERVSATTRIRQRRKQKEDSHLGSLAVGCAVILSLILTLSALGVVFAYRGMVEDLPSPEILPALLEPPAGLLLEPARFYDRTGTREIFSLSHPEAAGSTYVRIGQEHGIAMPAAMVTTTLVAADPGSWTEEDGPPGGTLDDSHRRIANRLVLNYLVQSEPAGWQRDLRQRLLVDQIQEQFGREQLLEWYLNSADYGNFAFGVDAAALVYFGKPAGQLSLAESAVLAGAAEAPALNPIDTPEEARARGRLVLRGALEKGWVETAQFRAAINEEIEFNPKAEFVRQPFESFVNLVRRQLGTQIGRDRIAQGGLRVRTTLDYDLQAQADCAIQSQLAGLRGQENPVFALDGEPCEAGRLIPSLSSEDTGIWLDPGGSAVIIEPSTGEVLALVGEPAPGQDPSEAPGRPPGSILAPYVHLAAYTRGLSPGSQAWDISASLPSGLENFTPEHWEYQGPVRLRSALANDYLAPTLQLLEQIGPDNVWGALPQLGFTSMDFQTVSAGNELLLGGGGTTLLDLVHGYSAFSNLGLLIGEAAAGNGDSNPSVDIHPVTILQIEDSNGNLIQSAQDRASRPVISSQLAYLITHSLSDEPARWASMGHPNLLEIGRPAAVKAGVTSDGRDLWTVGFTPNLVVGTWFGETAEAIPGQPTIYIQEPPSMDVAAGPWHAIMQYASADLPPAAWEQPPGVREIDVCDPSGLLPTQICPRVVTEVFLQGNEPIQLDNLYREYQINRETGRLATVFTPPELIQEQVYLVIPPAAKAWAEQSGVALPPDDYDLIFAPSSYAPGVSLDAPAMFTYVSGKTAILGTAMGPDFEYYRLQAGQGLNPQSWIQIGGNVTEEVEDNRLGLWDTRGLSGLYALQLLVVRDDQRVDKVTIQVTVDNTAPEIEILNPAQDQQFSTTKDRSTALQIAVSDDLALERVEVRLDSRKLATLVEPPYSIPLPLNPGNHILTVSAFDRAGNRTDARISFSVN